MLACIASEWPSAVGIERLLEMFWPQGPGTGEHPAYLAMMKAACSLRHPEESLCLCESCRRSLQRELAVEPNLEIEREHQLARRGRSQSGEIRHTLGHRNLKQTQAARVEIGPQPYLE